MYINICMYVFHVYQFFAIFFRLIFKLMLYAKNLQINFLRTQQNFKNIEKLLFI